MIAVMFPVSAARISVFKRGAGIGKKAVEDL